ncbi:MAG: hypothetical protein AAGI07_10900 [Bacteroidota bacterium]
MRKFIFFELNEVPYTVIDHFCQKYPSSHLAKTLPKCAQVETVSTDEGELSPWKTWPTVHRGVNNALHRIHDFGEDLSAIDEKYPSIWQILAQAGMKPGVFASMHTFPMPENYQDYSFFIPDPFAGDSKSYPKNIEPFQRFNLAMSRKSGRNVDTGIDVKTASALAVSLPKLGIQPKTLAGIAGQLIAERMENWKKNRRRVFQSVLAFDIYLKLVNSRKPAFSTFFSNHVASTMHRYWAATFPDHYEAYNLSDEWRNRFSGEIDYAMEHFDAFFKRLIQFADRNPEYKIVIASSMGQEATKAEELSTELYCKALEKFLEVFGISENDWEIKPAMHPQYNFALHSAEKALRLNNDLKKVIINGTPLIFRNKENFFSINFGHRNLEEETFTFKDIAVSLANAGLFNEQIDDESDGTAYHIPEGCFFIYDPQDATEKNNRTRGIPTTAIAPSFLEHFKLPVPNYMTDARIESLLK